MSEENKFSIESRGYKTRGYKYKHRYVKDKICPECGGNSAYRDEWGNRVSFKCMKRSCRHNWFEKKEKKTEPIEVETEETNETDQDA